VILYRLYPDSSVTVATAQDDADDSLPEVLGGINKEWVGCRPGIVNFATRTQPNTPVIKGHVPVWRGYIDSTALYELAVLSK
jgi:hypothetical protein